MNCKELCLPEIEPIFYADHSQEIQALFKALIQQILNIVLKNHMTFEQTIENADILEDQSDQLLSLLPLVAVKWPTDIPGDVAFYSLSKYRANSYKFFFDLLTNWLLPGKRLNLTLVNGLDFRIPKMSKQVFTLCSIMINVDNYAELRQLQDNFPIIESELKQGIVSNYTAHRIMEIKGLVHEEKTVFIQEYIAYLINRLPIHFGHDVLSEMQHVLVMCNESFKAARGWRHLTRLIAMQYLFRKYLRIEVHKDHNKRYLSLKIFQGTIKLGTGKKKVLCILVGMNFIKEKEVFEKKHLLKAIQNYIPGVQSVEDSFFPNRRGTEPVFTLYLEIEKNNGHAFTHEEIQLLQEELPNDLKDRIEHLMHPIFMPRNEEEIIRNILSLSNQIKYLRDIPQVFISFDEQTHHNLIFSVILVRIGRPNEPSIQELFYKANTFLEYIHDRCQTTGSLRRKYKKEATVFRVKLIKDFYLRSDHSIDLNKARNTVTSELFKIVGEFRDFNGGMISKQNEVLCGLRTLMQGYKYSELLLENFFYSLTPAIMRSVLDPEILFILFSMLISAIDSLENHSCNIFRQDKYVFVIIRTDDSAIRAEINRNINKLKIQSSQLACSYTSTGNIIYKGYIYHCRDQESQELFSSAIINTLKI